MKGCILTGNDDYRDEKKRFQHPGCSHPAIRPEPGVGFSSKGRGRPAQGRSNRRAELFPRIRPLNQEFEIVTHAGCWSPWVGG